MSWLNKIQNMFCPRTMEIKEKIVYIRKESDKLAKYWNDRWNKKKGFYRARNMNKYDVKSFIFENDDVLKEVIKKNNLEGKTNDETVLNCLKWVKKNIKYKPDRTKPYPEEWKFPIETLNNKYGDCEDQAILLVSLLLNCGIPSYRCKIAIGWANSGKNSRRFYHGYPIYLRNTDDQWVTIDTNSADVNEYEIWKRVRAKDNQFYESPNYTFNNQFTWAQTDFEITGRIKNENINITKKNPTSGNKKIRRSKKPNNNKNKITCHLC